LSDGGYFGERHGGKLIVCVESKAREDDVVENSFLVLEQVNELLKSCALLEEHEGDGGQKSNAARKNRWRGGKLVRAMKNCTCIEGSASVTHIVMMANWLPVPPILPLSAGSESISFLDSLPLKAAKTLAIRAPTSPPTVKSISKEPSLF
jgi:hypothetical protein